MDELLAGRDFYFGFPNSNAMKIDLMRWTPNLIYRCWLIMRISRAHYRQLGRERRNRENNAWRKVMRKPRRQRGPIIFYGMNTVSR